MPMACTICIFTDLAMEKSAKTALVCLFVCFNMTENLWMPRSEWELP